MRSTLKTAAAGITLAGVLMVGSASLVSAREASSGGNDRPKVEVERPERAGDSHGRGGRRGADDGTSTTITTVDDSTSSTLPGTDDSVGTPGDDDGTPDQGPGDVGTPVGAPAPTTVAPSTGPVRVDDHGVDDPATHDVGDDHGVDDPATHDVGDDHGDDDSSTSNHGSDDSDHGSDDHGSNSGKD